MDDEGHLVAAASVRWRREPCEIVELGVASERQGRGYGRRLMGWHLAEARRRGKSAIILGTRSTSASNIIFYQKCGFRMDHVRRDYFWYYDEPVFEHGIPVRDMLVFSFDLAAEPADGSVRRSTD